MSDFSDLLKKKYGPRFQWDIPVGAPLIEEEATVEILPSTKAGENFVVCTIDVLVKQAVILHQYGVIAAEKVPSTDYVGFRYQSLDPSHLQGALAWNVLANKTPMFSARTSPSDGSRPTAGFSLTTLKRVGFGSQPLYIETKGNVEIQIILLNPTGGGTIAPDGIRLTALLSGYSLSL